MTDDQSQKSVPAGIDLKSDEARITDRAHIRVALLSEVFPTAKNADELSDTLLEAKEGGAALVVLPELPLHWWVPAHKDTNDDDAEDPGGPREALLVAAAKRAQLFVLGGLIARTPTGERRNRSLLVGPFGRVRMRYDKIHLPDEPGFYEGAHYAPGDQPPGIAEIGDLKLGVQVCSDINRPVGAMSLAQQGAHLLLHPRATEPTTYERWRTVLQAVAITTSTWVLSVNRPRAEDGVPLGGPSVAIAPDGEIVAEGRRRMVMVEVDAARVGQARRAYPGYMPWAPEVYRRMFKI